jgi:tetraacyldisaccharide 4'-kinase
MSASPRSLLAPLTPLYRLALALRERRLASGSEPIRRLQHPVISIGNLSTGGTGKTPLTIALAQALTARAGSLPAPSRFPSAPAAPAPPQVAVDVLSRGYGRRSTQPARVDPNGSPDDYGDEPLLIARSANVPVYVAPQRYDAGLLAESEHPASPANSQVAPPQVVLHILDDGFQHRQLYRDLDILLLSRADLNDELLPAGNLREPLHAAVRAHILVIPADDPALESDLRARGLTQPIWRVHRHMQVPSLGNPVLAFCGIARPRQFFAGLSHAAIDIASTRAFPDHHRYTPGDLRSLAAKAGATGATSLLTTEKDAIRLRGLDAPLPIAIASLRTEIENTPAALDWLLKKLRADS